MRCAPYLPCMLCWWRGDCTAAVRRVVRDGRHRWYRRGLRLASVRRAASGPVRRRESPVAADDAAPACVGGAAVAVRLRCAVVVACVTEAASKDDHAASHGPRLGWLGGADGCQWLSAADVRRRDVPPSLAHGAPGCVSALERRLFAPSASTRTEPVRPCRNACSRDISISKRWSSSSRSSAVTDRQSPARARRAPRHRPARKPKRWNTHSGSSRTTAITSRHERGR